MLKYATAIVLASAGLSHQALQEACAGVKASTDTIGNYYCNAVKGIKYTNVGKSAPGRFVSLITDDGRCEFEDTVYDGALAPLNQGVSYHVRGPINFKEFAVYTLGAAPAANPPVAPREESHDHVHAHARRHSHGHLHNREAAESDEADGLVPRNFKASTKPEPSPVPAKGEYGRVGYYNAEQQIAQNITFLNNNGGQGSGSWSPQMGNTLSYMSADFLSGAASPQILVDKLIPSNKEFAIFTDIPCKGASDCGTARPGTPMLKGFEGDDKVFIAKVKMPLDGTKGFNADMPSLWILNSRIPRTMQYGACSCWQSGCGEFDIMEVLDSGDLRCKSTFHTKFPGGSSDYIPRPTDKYIKVATIFHSNTSSVTVKVVPDDFVLDTSISKKDVESWISPDSPDIMSLFRIVS